jgi:hypothetical protein
LGRICSVDPVVAGEPHGEISDHLAIPGLSEGARRERETCDRRGKTSRHRLFPGVLSTAPQSTSNLYLLVKSMGFPDELKPKCMNWRPLSISVFAMRHLRL